MLTAITIDRVTGTGKYAEVLDVLEVLARGDLSSGTNAAAVLIRESPRYRPALQALRGNDTPPRGAG